MAGAVLMHPDPPRIATGHETGARGRADRTGGVKVGKLPPVLGERIDVRSAVLGGAVTADVSVAEIVTEDDDEVGRRGREDAGEGDEEK